MNESISSYYDLAGLGQLKSNTQSAAAVREVAEQFESIFLNMMLKSVRDANVSSDLFASSSMRTYEQMFDQEVSLQVSRGGGIGLADLIESQLSLSRKLSE